jgi:glucose-6-phosphate dehydrogenase assembly protein OpcA
VSGPLPERPGAVLDRVDAELRALWATPPTPGDTPKARACTMNLVVVAETPARATQWVTVVDEVLHATPARAIIVGLDPAGPEGLEAGTTAVCTPREGGGPLVCSERITLIARGAVCARLHSCITALCATDVPTTLVWLGSVRADDAAFEPLARDASRIVLDAAQGSLASLARVVDWGRARAVADRPGVADLAWTRLAPWQEMCARMFDEPRLRALASQVTRVTLVQACTSRSPLGVEGSLLLGWLATRLGWKATAQSPRLALAREDGGAVRLALGAEPSSTAPRNALLAVRLEASADGATMRGQIAREPGADAATWRLEVTPAGGEPQRVEHHVRLRASETSRVLERTLHRPAHDPALGEAATWASELRGEELACASGGDTLL